MKETLSQPSTLLVARRGSLVVDIESTAPGSSTTADVTGWFGEGTVVYLELSAASASLRSNLEFYGQDDFSAGSLMYRAENVDAYSSAYEDRVPFHYRDLDGSGELHVRVTNNGTVASSYTLEIVGIGE
jgi:hypothetical protein